MSLPLNHRPMSIDEITDRRLAIYCPSGSGTEARLRAFARTLPGNWHVVKVYAGARRSLKRHSAFQDVIRDAKAGKFDVLLADSLSTMTRSMAELARLIDALTAVGVTIRTASEPFDTSTPVGRLVATFIGVTAELECDMRRRHHTARMAKRIADGKRAAAVRRAAEAANG